MELNINSPAYFSEHYGVDSEVYRFCQKVYLFFRDKEYSNILHIIGIVPVIAPQEVYDSGKWKESVQLVSNKSCAIITMRTGFEEYYNANSSEKIIQMTDLILRAVKKVKSKGKFDYEAFEKDFRLITKETLQQLEEEKGYEKLKPY